MEIASQGLPHFFEGLGAFFEIFWGQFSQIFTRDALLIVLAGLFGACIGLEREIARKDASLRTFSLICIGSCLFATLSRISVENTEFGDPSRMAAQIVTGIGFLGAGAIFKNGSGVRGLTTAALMWVTAAIGTCLGFNQIGLALMSLMTVFFVIISLRVFHCILWKFRLNGYSNEDID